MERAPDNATLGALGFAGICRETLRVILSLPPGSPLWCGKVFMLSLTLLAHVTVSRVLFSHAVAAGAGAACFVHLAANWAPFLLGEAALLAVILYLSHDTAYLCVLSVAPRYSSFGADADRDARSLTRVLRGLGVARCDAKKVISVYPGHCCLAARLERTGAEARSKATSRVAFLLLLGYTALSAAAAATAVVMHLPRAALLLVGGTAYLGGAAYIGAVWRVACVLSMLEDGDSGFRAMHASDELLTGAGKFWTAAAVFTTLDGYAVAVQLAFGALVVENWMGLEVWPRVATGVAIAAVLWAAVMAGLVAQVVVYFACKRCHGFRQSSDGTAATSLAEVGRRGRANRNRKRH